MYNLEFVLQTASPLIFMHTSRQLGHPCRICLREGTCTLFDVHMWVHTGEPEKYLHKGRPSHTTRLGLIRLTQVHFMQKQAWRSGLSKNWGDSSWPWSRSFYACRLVILDKQAISHMHWGLSLTFQKGSWGAFLTPSFSCLAFSFWQFPHQMGATFTVGEAAVSCRL